MWTIEPPTLSAHRHTLAAAHLASRFHGFTGYYSRMPFLLAGSAVGMPRRWDA